MLPERMTVIEAREPGGPEVLVPATRPVPKPGSDEVLIEVAAAGVNRPDVLQRMGLYPPPKGASDLLGLEVAGRIVARGEDAPSSQHRYTRNAQPALRPMYHSRNAGVRLPVRTP